MPTDKNVFGNLNFTIKENKEYVLLSVALPKRFFPKDRENVVLPRLDANKKLLLSGKIPSWLAMSILLSYDNEHKYVHTPGIGFVKVFDKGKIITEKLYILHYDTTPVPTKYTMNKFLYVNPIKYTINSGCNSFVRVCSHCSNRI